MGLRVWIVEEQTHAHVSVGFRFEPINKPMDREIDLNSYPNRAKTHRVLGSGYLLPSLAAVSSSSALCQHKMLLQKYCRSAKQRKDVAREAQHRQCNASSKQSGLKDCLLVLRSSPASYLGPAQFGSVSCTPPLHQHAAHRVD
jgi:hypothetical protein